MKYIKILPFYREIKKALPANPTREFGGRIIGNPAKKAAGEKVIESGETNNIYSFVNPSSLLPYNRHLFTRKKKGMRDRKPFYGYGLVIKL